MMMLATPAIWLLAFSFVGGLPAGLGLVLELGIVVSWWIVGMVNARRLCEQFNARPS
jgi:hypothetical protein